MSLLILLEKAGATLPPARCWGVCVTFKFPGDRACKKVLVRIPSWQRSMCSRIFGGYPYFLPFIFQEIFDIYWYTKIDNVTRREFDLIEGDPLKELRLLATRMSVSQSCTPLPTATQKITLVICWFVWGASVCYYYYVMVIIFRSFVPYQRCFIWYGFFRKRKWARRRRHFRCLFANCSLSLFPPSIDWPPGWLA